MTDTRPAEFERKRKLVVGVRNGLILIMRAMLEYNDGLTWQDFLPRAASATATPLAQYAPATSTPVAPFET
jgi:hypothetical protein